ncbi:mitotic fidelity of chromosome transmission- protein [Tilletia horrida]|nr:mitotic fidelity of chromosome transmission- protein [Tilletia horrida]
MDEDRHLPGDRPAEDVDGIGNAQQPGQTGIFWDTLSGKETTRRLACQREDITARKVYNADFRFQKVFAVGDSMAAGIVEIPVGGSKPAKTSKTGSLTFFVSEGSVRARIHSSSFVVGAGGMFLVPIGNQYSIDNMAEHDSRLFFAEARGPTSNSDDVRGVEGVIDHAAQDAVGHRFAGTSHES